MVNHIKFSEFEVAPLTSSGNEVVGLESGLNVQSIRFLTWTTAGRPASPFNGLLGLNTDLTQYEFWDSSISQWVQLEDSTDLAALIARLAAHTVNDGASMIGLLNQSHVTNKTVQDLADATFIAQTDNGTLQNAQFLGSLSTGILKSTTTTGVLSISTALTQIDNLSPVQGDLLYHNGSAWVLLAPSTAGYVLQTQGPGANPQWVFDVGTGTVTSLTGGSGITLTPDPITTTGSIALTVPVTADNGGTGLVSPTAHGIMIGEGASAMTPIVLIDGQILIGSTGIDPVAAAIGSGTGILVANGPGSISVGLAPVATLTGLVNLTGGSAAPAAHTLTEWIDAALGSTRGDILYRNATVWTVLAPGTAGFSLQTGGAGADPSYSNTFTNSTLVTPASLGVQQEALNMNSHLINNVTDPVSPQDAATKNYVDQNALTGTSVYAASAASLGTVTQSGSGSGATLTNGGTQATFALDGVNPPLNSFVLIKNTATGMTAANEGIYQVTNVGSGATNWVLTRSTNYDTPSQINDTGLIVVQNGSTLAGTAWYNTTTIVTVDTTNFSYAQFGNSGSVTSIATGTGLTGGPITTTGTISVLPTLHSISGMTTLDATDYQKTIVCTGSSAYTVTLPAHSAGTIIEFVINTTSNAIVTLSPASGTINGQATISLGTYDCVTLYDDGTNYVILRSDLQPVNFQAYQGSNQALTNATNTKANIDTKNYDVGSFFDTSTHVYTPLYPGKYKVFIEIDFSTGTTFLATDQVELDIYFNGAAVAQNVYIFPATTAANSILMIEGTYNFNGSTDNVYANVRTQSGSTVSVIGFNTVSFMEAVRVGLF